MASFHSVGNSSFAFVPRQEKVDKLVKRKLGMIGHRFKYDKNYKRNDAMRHIANVLKRYKEMIVESDLIQEYSYGATCETETDQRMKDIFKNCTHSIIYLLCNDYKNATWLYGIATMLIDEIAADFDTNLTTEKFKMRLDALKELRENMDVMVQSIMFIHIIALNEYEAEFQEKEITKSPIFKQLIEHHPSLYDVNIAISIDDAISDCPDFLKKLYSKNETQKNDFLIHFAITQDVREDIKKKKPSPPKKKEPITIENALDW